MTAKRGRETEEARFDFRESTTSTDSFSFLTVPWHKITDLPRQTWVSKAYTQLYLFYCSFTVVLWILLTMLVGVSLQKTIF